MNQWISIKDALPELKYGGSDFIPDASDDVEVAYRYFRDKYYYRRVVQYWREYGWVYKWEGGHPQTFERHGYVVDFWHYLIPLPELPEGSLK